MPFCSASRLAGFVVILLGCTVSGFAVQLKVPLNADAPKIDGVVSAEEQSHAASVDLGPAGTLQKPRHNTKVYVSGTLDGLYVGFIADDPNPSADITSATEENGAVFNDDSVQILITPTLDTSADAYYHFAVNPSGVRYSTYLLTGDSVSNWKSATSKTATNWQAEFFIPLDSIKAPQELPYWRVNFARYYPARGSETEETSAWVNPGAVLHNYKRFGYMTMPRFVPAAPTGNTPYTTSTVEVFTTASRIMP